jgi:hypothetical protein
VLRVHDLDQLHGAFGQRATEQVGGAVLGHGVVDVARGMATASPGAASDGSRSRRRWSSRRADDRLATGSGSHRGGSRAGSRRHRRARPLGYRRRPGR